MTRAKSVHRALARTRANAVTPSSAIYPRPVTPGEAVAWTGIGERVLLDAARAGEIPGAVKRGKKWLFSQRGLAEWLGFDPARDL